jgi:putative glutamine amidotransferase
VKRPRVGIPLAHDTEVLGRLTLRGEYARAVEKAGGFPIALPSLDADRATESLDLVDALLLVGGTDLDPALYGESPHPKLDRVFAERDQFELAICREALARDRPVLAICRGTQVLNVALGGTLIQDIPSELGGKVCHNHPGERWERVHDVRILEGTRLRELMGAPEARVNSIHHQAVRALGRGLTVSARSLDDDVIEGVEAKDASFCVGVQWHPEAFWDRSTDFDGLFRGFVEGARL